MRTAINLEVLGVLKNYNGVFDLDRYHKNVDDYISSLLLKENTMHDAELLTLLKANNRITRNHYLIALKKKLKKSLKKFLKVFRK
ncbi:hypothetical protein JCM19314_3402 [Nonlabens ulvanivorans]|uniref:Uncharacterized protein n=1 Tax=Nonlabens ulvanivorans TaxID=906888 RepID=A0A090QAV9_NONUL|nr:hypothetical protein [Nonlabens ulvanivorans]GAK99357.1 hypothetical protein JCM19314_3402 [Nonlabens ulvanivorans]